MDIIHIKYYIAYIVIYQTPDQSSACTARGYQTPAAVLQELAGGLCWILPVGSGGADVKIIATVGWGWGQGGAWWSSRSYFISYEHLAAFEVKS